MSANGSNLFGVPTPLMTGNDEPMIIDLKTIPVNDIMALTIPANTFSNIGDEIVCNWRGRINQDDNPSRQVKVIGAILHQGGAPQVVVYAASQGIDPDNIGDTIETRIALVGTNTLRCQTIATHRDSGGTQCETQYEEIYVDVSQQMQVAFFNGNDGSVNMEIDFGIARLTKNAGGKPNFTTPFNLVYDGGLDILSFDYDAPAYPEPFSFWIQYQLNDGTWDNLGTSVAGDSRNCGGIALGAPVNWNGYVRVVGQDKDSPDIGGVYMTNPSDRKQAN